MANVKITVKDNGSFLVEGNFELVDVNGDKFETKSKVSLCRCGLSNNMPFCDASHKGKFESKVRAKDL